MAALWARSLRRWILLGAAVVVILGALWWATLQGGLNRSKSAAATLGGCLAFVVLCGWELWEARGRVAAVREAHARTLETALAKPVYEMTVQPARVWGSPEDGWMFDVGGGRALFADWDLPEGAATERIVASVSPAGGMWFDQSGAELSAEPLPYLWENLRDDHPLLELVGAGAFKLDDDPGAALRDFEDYEWIVPPEVRNPD